MDIIKYTKKKSETEEQTTSTNDICCHESPIIMDDLVNVILCMDVHANPPGNTSHVTTFSILL